MPIPRARGVSRHDLERVPEPVHGFPVLATSVHNRVGNVAIIAVPDTYDARRRVRALARIDLLDQERRAGRLDEASYLVGREVERVFEGMSHVAGGGQWLEGDRVDAATSAELMAVFGAERAAAVNAFLAWVVRHVGRWDARLLWMVLGERMSFVNAAAAFGRGGYRGRRYAMDRFSDALAALAEVKAAKGRRLR